MPDITVIADEGMVGSSGTVRLVFRARAPYYDGDVLVKPRGIAKDFAYNVAKTVSLRPGPWQVSGIGKTAVYFDVGETATTLKALIETNLDIPGTAPTATLSQAVEAWMAANVNTEVTDTMMTSLLADPDSDASAAVAARAVEVTADKLSKTDADASYAPTETETWARCYAGTARRYVSPIGSDTNDGRSAGDAFLTAEAAYADLPAGGEVIMLPGVHLHPANTFKITNTATIRNKPVTFRGAGVRKTIWQRTVDLPMIRVMGDPAVALDSTMLASDVSFEQMTFDGQGFDAGGPGYSSNLIELLEVNHIEFDRYRLYNVAGTGLFGRAVENSKMQRGRHSALGTTVGSNRAGMMLTNGTSLESNGFHWNSIDFEITYGGRDIHIIGDTTRKAQNFIFITPKFESAPSSAASGYAPSQRVLFERVDEALFVGAKFIRGLGTQLDVSLSAKVRVIGSEFIDGQGAYALRFQDGDGHLVDTSTFQGSAAMSTAGGAHIRIDPTAIVNIGSTRHTIVGTEKAIDDLSGQGRRMAQVRDSVGAPMPFQKAGVTAGGSGYMGAIQGSTVEYVVPRSGRLVALTAYSSATITAGTITFTAQKNGSAVALQTVLNTANKSRVTDLGYSGGVAVAAGDVVRVEWSASADIAPSTANLNAMLYVVPDVA
ncbi:hypothetical protein ACPXCG_18855 [Gordonia sp. DT218]|uniref:hypothetical protein n=1 Tax=Gordonia sp. DT218 TaxID=3416659 RepID=UPI003CF1A39B